VPKDPAELGILPADEITTENVHMDENTGTFQFDDDAALKLVLDDAQADDTFMNVNQWPANWLLADTLYQSPLSSSCFDGGNVSQANVPKFTVSNHISSIVPKLMGGIFYEDPPFLLRPGPDTTTDIVRAKTAVFSAQLRDMKFEEESERSLDQMALLGTLIMKWGYVDRKKILKKYRRSTPRVQVTTPAGPQFIDTPESDAYVMSYEEQAISRPWIKFCDIRTVLVASSCRVGDITKASHVTYRDYATYTDLDGLRGVEGYDIPDTETLKSFFITGPMAAGPDNPAMTIPEGMRGYLQHAVPRNYKSSADPLQNGLEILERWDPEKVIVVLACNGHNILIRNEANPYGKVPFLSANWRNIGDSFYGQGLGLLIGGEQLIEQGLTNMSLDMVAYGVQPTGVRKRGFNSLMQTTTWKLGGIIDVEDDVDKSFKFMEMPQVPPAVWQFIQQSQSAAAATSGANEQVIQGAGSQGNKATGMRSGTGAAAVVQANESRLDGPDGRFIRQVFEPWLYIMDELDNEHLPTSVLKQILGDELGKDFKVDHIDFRNATLKYEVLAGAHLGPKKEMAQFLPVMLQMFNNPTFTGDLNDAGQEWDAVAIFKNFADSAGWKFSQNFIRAMSAERKAMKAANSPAALQANKMKMMAQNQQQSQQAQFQHDTTMEDQKQLGKAGNEVLRQAVEQSSAPEEITGEPGGVGFGSQTV
jgi:hypothetical protein